MTREKRPWPKGTVSPWATDPNPPTVLEAARMYPGRALATLAAAAILGLIVTFAVALVIDSTTSPDAIGNDAAFVLIASVMSIVTVPTWWGILHQEIRGRLVSSGWEMDND